MDLYQALDKIKPHLKMSSMKTYVTIIEKLHEAMYDHRSIQDLHWLVTDKERIMKMLLLKPDSTNRNYLNAITIFLQHENRDTYRDLQEWQEYSQARDDLNDKMAKAIQLNLRTDRQKKNWITPEEYQHVLDQIESTLRQSKIFSAKCDSLSRDQARKYQEYVLLRLYEKVPSRNDFATVCVITKRQYNENHHDDKNYLVLERDNYHFMLHDWKTKTAELDQRQILLSPRLQKVIRLFLRKFSSRPYLFMNSSGDGPLTRNGLTKLMVNVFKQFYPDRSISTTMLRHVFLTHKYGQTLDDMKQDANNLGHSLKTQKDYIVNDY